jgi:hypothetical protein
MLLVADHLRVKALLEKMADAVVSLVEPLRVDPVQAMHAARDVFELGLDDQMKVVVEQAKGVNGPAETRSRVGEEMHPAQAVGVVDDDRHPRDAADGEVVDAGGRKNAARHARHPRHRTAQSRTQSAAAPSFHRHVTGTVP